MKHLVSSSGNLHAFVCLGLLWFTTGAAGQQPPASKESKQIQMFTPRPDGNLTEITSESAFLDHETLDNFERIAWLSGPKAKIRFSNTQAVRVIAVLPKSVDPRQLQLRSFKSRGLIRIADLGPVGRSSIVHDWNTHSFVARHSKDGRWMFEPESQLAPGEYCFSPTFNNDHYCFGVDGQ
jgi:hypothetical protein